MRFMIFVAYSYAFLALCIWQAARELGAMGLTYSLRDRLFLHPYSPT